MVDSVYSLHNHETLLSDIQIQGVFFLHLTFLTLTTDHLDIVCCLISLPTQSIVSQKILHFSTKIEIVILAFLNQFSEFHSIALFRFSVWSTTAGTENQISAKTLSGNK